PAATPATTPVPAAGQARATIARLAQAARLAEGEPLAARFVYSLRLIALHERVGRDPVPELAVRLGSVAIAAKTLALAEAVRACWPENIRLNCFCSPVMTHDEATLAALVGASLGRDKAEFDAQIEGFVRPSRVPRLWDAALGLVTAELRAL
ncbi:MAG: hypothetical protein V2I27_03075, partial [Erythrobacter sp.]|nr:hypothetical protein [Erythrobacter sp.]